MKNRPAIILFIVGISLFLMAGPGRSQDTSAVILPFVNAAVPSLHAEMQSVINKLTALNGRPLMQLTITEARQNPTAADAILALMFENNIQTPPSTVDTSGREIQVPKGTIRLRMYTPRDAKGLMPVIVYYHGGGWVIGDPDTYDASARALARQTGAVVVSVAYRRAPEYKFPTAHNDSYAAYKWVVRHAKKLKGDAKMIAVAGESAGGNLAAAVAIMARDEGFQMPVHQLLIYPVAGHDFQTPSYNQHAAAKPLDKPMMQWFFDMYLGSAKDAGSPWISLVEANLTGLPAATIIRAQIDPLESEGSLLEEKLKAAGVAVHGKTYEGVTHEFFGMAALVPDARDAQAYAAARLKEAFKRQ